MSDQQLKVMRDFLELPREERDQFIEEISKYEKMDYIDKYDYGREIRKQFSVGPKNSVCQYYGRG